MSYPNKMPHIGMMKNVIYCLDGKIVEHHGEYIKINTNQKIKIMISLQEKEIKRKQ